MRVYSPASLFAGKIHAILYRSWKTRVKGRDFYDFIWFLKNKIPLNIEHLRLRALQSGKWPQGKKMNLTALKKILKDKFDSVDFGQAKQDVLPFIKDPRDIELWSAPFFNQITDDMLSIE